MCCVPCLTLILKKRRGGLYYFLANHLLEKSNAVLTLILKTVRFIPSSNNLHIRENIWYISLCSARCLTVTHFCPIIYIICVISISGNTKEATPIRGLIYGIRFPHFSTTEHLCFKMYSRGACYVIHQ